MMRHRLHAFTLQGANQLTAHDRHEVLTGLALRPRDRSIADADDADLPRTAQVSQRPTRQRSGR